MTNKSALTTIAAKVNPAVVDIVSRVPGAIGAGTGVVISASGDVLTNNHVIDAALQIQVTLVSTGQVFDAIVVNTDPVNDIAVIHLSGAANLATAPIGDSDAVQVSDPIVAIGNAGGKGGTPSVVSGTVTALHRPITASDPNGADTRTLTDLIQVDANIQPGDSGGPLVSADAKVIGIDVAASFSRTRRALSIHEGFAIPINRAMSISKQLQAHPAPPVTTSDGQSKPTLGSGFLGVGLDSSTSTSGATVKSVQPGSPAETAGLKAGDVITGLDGAPIASRLELQTILTHHKGGDHVAIDWQSQSVKGHADVVLGSR